MSRAQEVVALKNQMAVLGSDPVMNSHGDISTLRSLLASEKQVYDQALSQNGPLNNKLSQVKSDLEDLQQQYDNLTVTKKNQEAMVAKVDSYLTDFNDNANLSSSLGEELAQKLAGDISQLKMD